MNIRFLLHLYKLALLSLSRFFFTNQINLSGNSYFFSHQLYIPFRDILVIVGDIIPRIFEIVEGISWKKKRRCSTLLLHSAAQLAELRTCRSVENVTSPISKRQPSVDVENPSSLFPFSGVSISFYFTSVGDVVARVLEKMSRARRRCLKENERCERCD